MGFSRFEKHSPRPPPILFKVMKGNNQSSYKGRWPLSRLLRSLSGTLFHSRRKDYVRGRAEPPGRPLGAESRPPERALSFSKPPLTRCHTVHGGFAYVLLPFHLFSVSFKAKWFPGGEWVCLLPNYNCPLAMSTSWQNPHRARTQHPLWKACGRKQGCPRAWPVLA